MYKRKVIDVLNSDLEVPTMLSISLQIDALSRDTRSTVDDISKVIRLDPALTGKVLRVANSSIYASVQRVVSLQQAIAKLGLNEIRRITMSIAIINSFKNTNVDYERFWIHSITVAFIAEAIATKTNNQRYSGEVYISGLLHDIGVLVMDQYLTDIYNKVFNVAVKNKYDLQIVEGKILGITHAEVGGILLKKWKIPDNVTDCVLCHHYPQEAEAESSTITKIVYLANVIANNRGIHNGTGFFPQGFYDDIWEDIGLPIDQVSELIKAIAEDLFNANELLRLSTG